jgi:hypothetical protein
MPIFRSKAKKVADIDDNKPHISSGEKTATDLDEKKAAGVSEDGLQTTEATTPNEDIEEEDFGGDIFYDIDPDGDVTFAITHVPAGSPEIWKI